MVKATKTIKVKFFLSGNKTFFNILGVLCLVFPYKIQIVDYMTINENFEEVSLAFYSQITGGYCTPISTCNIINLGRESRVLLDFLPSGGPGSVNSSKKILCNPNLWFLLLNNKVLNSFIKIIGCSKLC